MKKYQFLEKKETNDRLINFRVSRSIEEKLKQLDNTSAWLRSLIEEHRRELDGGTIREGKTNG